MTAQTPARFRLLLVGLGLLELATGLVAGFCGPLEIYVFHLFSDGGTFAYPGFGVGSLWFTALVAHNLGYYLLATALLPLGYATLRRRAWARRATLVLAWLWLLLGIWAMILLPTYALSAFPLAELSGFPERIAVIGVGLAILTLGLPVVFIWLFNRAETRMILSVQSGFADWLDARPIPLLLALFGCGLVVIALHMMALTQAFWPMFGSLSFGRANMYPIAATILVLSLAMVGLAGGKRLGLLLASAVIATLFVAFVTTFWQNDSSDLVAALTLSETERGFLVDAPLPGTPFLLLASGLPLGGLLTLLALSWRFFANGSWRSVDTWL